MNLLQELLDVQPDVKESKPYANKIAHLLFGRKAGPVVDEKRSKKPIFFGVAHERSKLTDADDKSINLTFDNSTDSGEFEINSLVPLKIVKGDKLDKMLHELYKKHKVKSKKRINYLDVDGELYVRELHLGKELDDAAVKLTRDAVKLMRGEALDDDDDEKPKQVDEAKSPVDVKTKLEELHDDDQKLKLIFEWVKTGVINYKTFSLFVTLI